MVIVILWSPEIPRGSQEIFIATATHDRESKEQIQGLANHWHL